MLTIFSIPKPFRGHIGTIQRNAIQSWLQLSPRCEVILCGNDPGVAEAAAEYGVKHLPHIARKEYGTPFLNSAFEHVQQVATERLIAYVNADIIFLSDLMASVKRITAQRFLMVGQRWELDVRAARSDPSLDHAYGGAERGRPGRAVEVGQPAGFGSLDRASRPVPRRVESESRRQAINSRGSTKLKIFTDRAYLHGGRKHVAMLYPFWGKNPEDPGDPSSGRYDRYVEVGSRLFEVTTLEKAEVAVFPGAWEQVLGDTAAVKRAEQFLELARRARKPTVIFFWSDSDEAIRYRNTVVFRTSLYRSRRRRNEFAMPAWSEDFVTRYLGGQLPLRSKGERAVVGFCGYAPSFRTSSRTLRGRLKQAVRGGAKRLLTALGLRKTDGSIRTTVLRILAASPVIDANFKMREHFLGGALVS